MRPAPAPPSPALLNASSSTPIDYFSPTACLLEDHWPSSGASPFEYDAMPRPGRTLAERRGQHGMLRFVPSAESERSPAALDLAGHGSSSSGVRNNEAARSPVQLGETATVNWARPLRRAQSPPLPPLHVFGASMQRTRRLNCQSQASHASMPSPLPSPATALASPSSMPSPLPSPATAQASPSSMPSPLPSPATAQASPSSIPSPLPSPATPSPTSTFPASTSPASSSPASSFDDDPQTPSPVMISDSARLPDRVWSYLADHHARGVGQSTWDASDPFVVPRKPSAIETPPPTPMLMPPPPPPPPTPTTSSRFLVSSQSMSDYASPSTLDQLRSLRQAAVDLVDEVRNPVTPPQPHSTWRRIPRKAVPSLDVDPDLDQPNNAASPRPQTPPGHSRRLRTRTFDPNPPILPPGSNASTDVLPAPLPSPRERASYQTQTHLATHLATHSVIERSAIERSVIERSAIEVSPRNSSLPFRVPPRAAAAAAVPPWDPVSCASSVSDSAGHSPTTPYSARSGHGDPEAFLSQMDRGLKRLEEDGKGKHRRGLSRFLGRKHNEA